MEKIQIPEYLSLYDRLKDFFDIKIHKSNKITGSKTCKNVYYTLVHVLFPVNPLLLPIIMSKTSFKRPYNDRNSGI